MRITRPIAIMVRQATKVAVKRIATGVIAIAIVVGGVVGYQNILTTPESAMAVTPPDSCFAWTDDPTTPANAMITDYYDFEANNSANPACTRDVDIPSSLGGQTVISIDNFAFYANQLTSVTITDSVTSIGDYAFIQNQLTSITLQNPTVTTQHSSFAGNPITSITLGTITTTAETPTTNPACFVMSGSTVTDYHQASVEVLKANGVLCGTSVAIPSGVTSIGNSAFYANQLTAITIPSGVTSIGVGAFRANQLTAITIPSGVVSIRANTFAFNRITTVAIPGLVSSIYPTAFIGQNDYGVVP